ncbi:hypothetical protein D187_007069 [Cystobacter fuscus DSM 2262]|uniref:Uncharacterized protein n=1 Tax=Cystobacter fuscus (strain ATCC 25194 / DSM 2262 / NBRC 100088 / M29) TaxID=1242864 RepID=S9NYL3_CYSF2|nr:DUF6640 family protein [Cystobacter fuscus]EPX57315.1 hypothetical protein D187_007069 [Cystobacter fuscus DSM 2262]
MKLPLGRWLISLVALLALIGPYGADWNETHLFNPHWSPHAKFHDAQTMLLGTFCPSTSSARNPGGSGVA